MLTASPFVGSVATGTHNLFDCHVMSCHVMSCHVMSCHVMPCHAMPCHAMPCHAMPCSSVTFTMFVPFIIDSYVARILQN